MASLLTPDADGLAHALERLRSGGLVAFPTETVYGLGADATQDEAVAHLFAAKGRPRFNPLIAHVAQVEDAYALGSFGPLAQQLAQAFWPGPLTLVVARKADCPVSLLATAGLETIAVRVPAHGIARALLLGFGGPLVAPSANRSGRVSPTEAAHVAEDFADEDLLILDGGPTAVGLESTVIDVTGATPSLLRPGAIARADLERLVGPLAAPEGATAPASPGQLASHYAPSLPVRLNVRTPHPDETLIAFGPEVPEGALRVLNLSSQGDLLEAAANLFRLMRAADAPPARAIAVMPIPETGLGEAINDRLARAAAPRP